MKSLLIETCTERGVIAISDAEKILYQKQLPYGLQNSSYLLPAIEEVLKNANVLLTHIELITIGIGPGSYTGIRMGAIAAKTLSYALKIPLVGVCTLNCFAPKDDGKFAAIIDAKIGGFYLLKGFKNDHTVKYEFKPTLCLLNDLEAHLSPVNTLVTPNKQRIAPILQNQFPHLNFEWEESDPDVNQLLLQGQQAFEKGHFSINGSLELMYLRKTQAEIEREKL
jgi:tRNA threonylcarbamoyladenosine biosynthesis protein TsaB